MQQDEAVCPGCSREICSGDGVILFGTPTSAPTVVHAGGGCLFLTTGDLFASEAQAVEMIVFLKDLLAKDERGGTAFLRGERKMILAYRYFLDAPPSGRY
jgi:hypothetical protein